MVRCWAETELDPLAPKLLPPKELISLDGDRYVHKTQKKTEEIRVEIDLAQGSGQSNTGAVICPTCKSHHRRDQVQPRVRGRLTVGEVCVWGVCFKKCFVAFFLRKTLHIHLQRKHALWFCNISLDWQRAILRKPGKQKLYVQSQLRGRWLICYRINTCWGKPSSLQSLFWFQKPLFQQTHNIPNSLSQNSPSKHLMIFSK